LCYTAKNMEHDRKATGGVSSALIAACALALGAFVLAACDDSCNTSADCGSGEICKNGECVKSGCSPACAAGEACIGGRCIELPGDADSDAAPDADEGALEIEVPTEGSGDADRILPEPDAGPDAGDGIELELIGPLRVLETRFEADPLYTLIARATVTTSRLASVAIEFGPDESYGRQTARTAAGTEHRLAVVGLRAETLYHLWAVARAVDGGMAHGEDQIFTTGALPAGVPEMTVTIHDRERMQPGITLFGPYGEGDNGQGPQLVGVDETGEVVWYYYNPGDAQSYVADAKVLPDGHLLVQDSTGFRVITLSGETIHEIRFPIGPYSMFHHDVIPLPNGNFLALSREFREVEVGWNPEPIMAMGDVLLEISPQSEEVWGWSTFEHLDQQRYPDALSRTAKPFGAYGSVYDWTHGNGLFHRLDDDSILLSLRHQHWVIRIDRSTGDVVWRFGPGGDFELTDLEPLGDGLWPYGPHAPEWHPDGSLALYDNGNERPPDWPEVKFSRGAAYRLDEDLLEAEQIWSFRTEYFTRSLGDNDRLPNGNYLICAGGAAEDDGPARIVEVTGDEAAEAVWTLQIDDNTVYRATRIESFR